jgi:hypothetical protein
VALDSDLESRALAGQQLQLGRPRPEDEVGGDVLPSGKPDDERAGGASRQQSYQRRASTYLGAHGSP